ncbi:hypothetical protein EYC84_008045 [Monilinia fructicola]|uniref:Uncharacterized protein n=1 Tax=Monilinia fructicola TaxID=38448 RepID=A0A5M9JFY6_MONFR|nr:hypothetical protein EYC84_008045 [Monilinia fructicola]
MEYPQSSSPPTAAHIMADQTQLHTTQNAASLIETPGITGNLHGNEIGIENGNHNGGLGNYQSGRRDLTVNDIADIDDPILLLETLTKWDSRSDNNFTSTHTNAQFASLLQAAETAGGVNDMRSSTPSSNNGNGQSTRGSPTKTSSKHRRDESEEAAEEEGEMFGFINAKSKPRKVRKLTAEEEEEAAREREIWGSEPSDLEDEEEGEGEDSNSKYSTIPNLNPRAYGVHGAAAIFRKTSAAGRKYTRPAMSSVFTKLELAPEDFITLQAAAKDYMLDPRHPDRSACVGSKGKRDSDMTKLKLYACVRNFLSDEGEGWGEKLFGKNSPSGATRKWMWPQMPNRIISRRRKEEELFQLQAASSNAVPASKSLSIDPKLNLLPNRNVSNATTTVAAQTQTANTPEVSVKQPAPLEYHINILHNGKRIKDMFTLNPTNCVGFVSFTAHVDAAVKAPYKKTVMKVLGPNGLVEVKSEATYAMALVSVRKAEWMDGDVKIIVETEKMQ